MAYTMDTIIAADNIFAIAAIAFTGRGICVAFTGASHTLDGMGTVGANRLHPFRFGVRAARADAAKTLCAAHAAKEEYDASLRVGSVGIHRAGSSDRCPDHDSQARDCPRFIAEGD